ncbi:hypothetical protein JCM10213_007349 [Rhodosporidiobolus nylandii]
MARRKEHHSPSRVRHLPKSTTPSLAVRLLAALFAPLPFLFPSTARQLLVPLFSSAPVTAPEASYALYGALAVVLLLGRWRRWGLSGGWRAAWVAMGTWKVLSEALIRLGGEKLLGLGLTTGVRAGTAILEAVPLLALGSWVWGSWWCKERRALLPPWYIPTLFVFSLLPPVQAFFSRFAPLVPECYILQTHGLLLASMALLSPSASPNAQHLHVRASRSPSRSKSSSPKPPSPSSSLPSFPLRIASLASLLLLAHLTALTSSHCPTSPSSLPPPSSKSRVLSSRLSTTGWIVVGEQSVPVPGGGGDEMEMTFRYLRADHSLLGGLWVGPSRWELEREQRARGGRGEVTEQEVVRRAESIYSTFILQELVRLVQPPPDLPRQSPEQGLIIGLGAGLSARALAAHGVNLTVCEIDPEVYKAARTHFGVEEPAEVVLEDAVQWVDEQNDGGKLFDYIIHDVFTGGALPTSLFTFEFWASLKPLLHPAGVLAVNFAGSLASPSSKLILSTLLASFAHCRAFEDTPQEKQPGEEDGFKNLVVFCTPSWFLPVNLRAPLSSDYLQAPSPIVRQRVFATYAQHEVDLSRFRFGEDEWGRRERERWMFRKGMEGRMEKMQKDEVGMHWKAMEGVLPRETWARW